MLWLDGRNGGLQKVTEDEGELTDGYERLLLEFVRESFPGRLLARWRSGDRRLPRFGRGGCRRVGSDHGYFELGKGYKLNDEL